MPVADTNCCKNMFIPVTAVTIIPAVSHVYLYSVLPYCYTAIATNSYMSILVLYLGCWSQIERVALWPSTFTYGKGNCQNNRKEDKTITNLLG